LDRPIDLLFFYSVSATEDVPQIRSYGNRVQELLREIVIASNGDLRFEVIDPEPFSEDEDLATQYGIRAVPVTQGGEGIYFGLVAIQQNDQVPDNLRSAEVIPLIRPDQEEFLEYEVMKLISQVNNPERVVVGLLTELDIDGGFDPMSGQSTQPWMIMLFGVHVGFRVQSVFARLRFHPVEWDPRDLERRLRQRRGGGRDGDLGGGESPAALTCAHSCAHF
jgi:ABC-type uncharacterized transport system involved in gliding motility auxiliary subunit